MASYKEEVGTAVQNIAGDDGVVTGQLWYDSSDSEFKYKYQAYGDAWSTQNAMNTARRYAAGAGTQTSAIAMGGDQDPPHVANVETWNGSSWSETTDLNTSRGKATGAGESNTSSLIFGGYTTTQLAVTESWNGSAWTEA